jgi:endonuclease/exonuclease/phosphatase family metal-dependent hydrolase
MGINSMIWNARSLRDKVPELSQFVHKNKIKLVLISETWLTKNSYISCLPEFYCYRVDRSHGGVCILIHQAIPHTFLKQISLDYAEALFIKIHYPLNDFTVTALYCSPSATRTQAKTFFSKVLSFAGPLIIGGDFNAKHCSWNNHKIRGKYKSEAHYKGDDLSDMIIAKNFSVHAPDGATLIPNIGEPSVVDFVLSKSIPGISLPRTINALSSDHLPVVFCIPVNDADCIDLKIFNFKKANWKNFRSSLLILANEISQKQIHTTKEVDDCIAKIVSETQVAMDKAIPKKLPDKRRYPFNRELHTLTKTRNYYRKQFLGTGDSAFRSIKNQLDKLIKRLTSKINQNSFNEKLKSLDIKDNSLYKMAKCLKMKKTVVPPLKKLNGDIAYSPEEKAEAFAEAFSDSHKTSCDLISKHDKKVKKSLSVLKKSTIDYISVESIKKSEVDEIIQYLNVKKAHGEDKISNGIIKRMPDQLISQLIRIFEQCLLLSYFPKNWKIGKVISILKPGKDPSEPKSYRPISLISNIGKILEKLILNRLKAFEESKNIFIPNQFGFRNQHSTIQQVLRIVKKAAINFNNRKSTGMLLLDIEKAFDTVWFDGLIHKLVSLKFPIYLIKVIQSYLKDRKSYVEFQRHKSNQYDVPAGVPQGSILAPFLFNLFVTDIPTPKNCDLLMYADDTAVSTESSWKRIKTIKKNLENALCTLDRYFSSWKVRINKSKTEFIIFTKSTVMIRKMHETLPQHEGETFKWSESVRYLGVNLDRKLLFDNHISKVIIKANAAISTLFCLLKFNSALDSKQKILVYKLYVRPMLTYAGVIYLNCAKKHLKKLQIKQNKCLRMALNASIFTPISTLHAEANIPTIEEFIGKNAKKFYSVAETHKNKLVSSLGIYPENTLPFGVIHRLPKTF